MTFFHFPKSKGFTLLETMVTMGVFIVVILMVASLYSLAQRSYNTFEEEMELAQNGRVALDRLSREVRQSLEITTSLSPDPASTTEEIMFRNGHDDDTVNYIRYYLDGSDLRRSRVVYYFEEDPETYVRHDSTNKDGDSPDQDVIEDKVVGEYFKKMEFWGEAGFVNASTTLEKDNKNFSLKTGIFSRNY